MSTQLRDVGDEVEVTTVVGLGKRKKMPRTPVRIPQKDIEAIREEIIRQADLARANAGVNTQ